MIDGYVKNNNDEVLKEKGYFWGRRCRSKVLDKLHHTLSKLTERERDQHHIPIITIIMLIAIL